VFRKTLEGISVTLSKGLILLIATYQYLLSPLLGQNCRFFPCCSDYAKVSIERFGFAQGIFLTVKRLCRCAPWSPGGIDEVPEYKGRG
jgi:putative membrane protein insertion efficiency factor